MRDAIKTTEDQYIRNREFMMQPIVFNGSSLKGGMTDVDACYDVYGKAFIFIEVKRAGHYLEKGQAILFKNLAKHMNVPCYCLTAWQFTENGEDIMLKDCIVKEMTRGDGTGKVSYAESSKKTVKEIVDYIEKKHGVRK
jgi:hypothetical protein